MARYVDGYVIPLKKKDIPAYKRIAKIASKVWIDHGALEYRECVLEDGKTKSFVPFAKLAKLRPGETVVFAWVVYRSRAARDRINGAVMKDPRLANMDMASMPVDAKRMTFGGFDVLVEA